MLMMYSINKEDFMEKEDLGIMELLKKVGLFEVSKVSIFNGYYKDGVGQDRDIEIRVLDRGEQAHTRYFVVVETIDGGEKRTASGNGGDSLDEAILAVHWSDLG